MKAVMARTLGRGVSEFLSWAAAEEKARSQPRKAAAKRIKNGSVFIVSRLLFTSLLGLRMPSRCREKCDLPIFGFRKIFIRNEAGVPLFAFVLHRTIPASRFLFLFHHPS